MLAWIFWDSILKKIYWGIQYARELLGAMPVKAIGQEAGGGWKSQTKMRIWPLLRQETEEAKEKNKEQMKEKQGRTPQQNTLTKFQQGLGKSPNQSLDWRLPSLLVMDFLPSAYAKLLAGWNWEHSHWVLTSVLFSLHLFFYGCHSCHWTLLEAMDYVSRTWKCCLFYRWRNTLIKALHEIFLYGFLP